MNHINNISSLSHVGHIENRQGWRNSDFRNWLSIYECEFELNHKGY